ncbi:hypothetical protein AMTRI_Chr04g188730 [Amborella trichopoda]
MAISNFANRCFGLTLCLLLVYVGARETPNFKFRAVNLGAWLVTEGWIKPSLFDGVPNKDLLFGTQVQFKSVKLGTYLCAEGGGGSIIVANRTSASGWESFKLWRTTNVKYQFKVFNGQFIGQGVGLDAVAVANTPGSTETFEIIRNTQDNKRVQIKGPNGMFLQAKTQDRVTVDFQGDPGWGDDSPAVFVLSIVNTLQGEYQITNGYGPEKATKVMNDHWNSFIVEDDFKFMSKNGINSVRIPVGWWIASDPAPPSPFVGGSLKALDRAFTWAEKYGLKVIIDLHAAPGSQNGFEHSASTDGSQEWGKTQENIDLTVSVIEFLASRYASREGLAAVELINEPLSPGVSLETITKYYRAGYDAVRKHSPTAYVIMSNRLGPANSTELFPLANRLRHTVIDVHYYNLFSSEFDTMTVQQNIDFVYNNRSQQLNSITRANGPLTFVGEWVAEWQVQGASQADYQRFAKAQLEVYGRASFGWAYWTLKNVNNHWSLQWMIQNKYIQL